MQKAYFACAIVIIAFLIAAQSALAEQHLLLTGKITWSGKSMFYRSPSNPSDWHNPDYYHGDFFLRMEILEKPTDHPMIMQICLWHGSGKNEDCITTLKCPRFSQKGEVVWFKWTDLSTIKHIEGIDWTGQNLSKILFQMRMQKGSKWPEAKTCSESKCYGPGADDHYPVTWDADGVIVSKGSTLDPKDPEINWTGCPWGCDGVAARNYKAFETKAGTFYAKMLTVAQSPNEIRITAKSDISHSLALYNSQGKMVKALSGNGDKTHCIESSNMRSGMYVIAATIDGKKVAESICLK